MSGLLRLFLLALFVIAAQGCLRDDVFEDDLELARKSSAERNWPLAERLLERYLREEQDQEKRWEAWEMLLQAINANGQEPRATMECLEAMLAEYEGNEARLALILAKMGKYNEALRRYDRAADAWSAYVDLAEIDDMARMEGYRRLASAQFGQRHFDAGEESLQQCLALPLADHDKIYCMLDLADAGMMRERWQDVANLCQQIMDAEPSQSVLGLAGYLRADALEQMNQDIEALKQFETARDLYPNPAVMDNRIEHLRKKLKIKKDSK